MKCESDWKVLVCAGFRGFSRRPVREKMLSWRTVKKSETSTSLAVNVPSLSHFWRLAPEIGRTPRAGNGPDRPGTRRDAEAS